MHKITIKINQNYDIIPTNTFDRYVMKEKLKPGIAYICKISKGRAIKVLGKYWLLMSAFAYYQNQGSSEFWHNEFKKMYFGFIEVYNPLTGEVVKEVKSISFEKMEEIEFEEYLKWIEEKLVTIGIDASELIMNYKEVV